MEGDGLKGRGIKRWHGDRGLDLHHGHDSRGGVQYGRLEVSRVRIAHGEHAATGRGGGWQENLDILARLWIQQHLPLSLWRCIHIEELQRRGFSHVAEGGITESCCRRWGSTDHLGIVQCLLWLWGFAGAVPLVNRGSGPIRRTLVLLIGDVSGQTALVLLRGCQEVEEGSSWEGWDVAQWALHITPLCQLRRQGGGEGGQGGRGIETRVEDPLRGAGCKLGWWTRDRALFLGRESRLTLLGTCRLRVGAGCGHTDSSGGCRGVHFLLTRHRAMTAGR